MLLKKESLTRFAAHTPRIILCPGVFLAAYGTLPLLSGSRARALTAIFIAHLASNILFAAGAFGVLRSFHLTQTASASGKAWR